MKIGPVRLLGLWISAMRKPTTTDAKEPKA
jgi:hypothetical protein